MEIQRPPTPTPSNTCFAVPTLMPFDAVEVPQQSFFIQGAVGHRVIIPVAYGDTVMYRGRLRRWPGAILLALALVLPAILIVLAGSKQHEAVLTRLKAFNYRQYHRKDITGGANGSDLDDIVGNGGEIGNPAKYPENKCTQPNYLSKEGKIFAVADNGTEVPISIKGVNWFGMETGQAMVFGLWDNATAGTTAYHVASFLSANKFNAVRIPLMIDHILKNTVPNRKMINQYSNQAVSVKNYMSLLKSLIQVLQFRRIGVLISLHTLNDDDTGGLWYNDAISEDDFLHAVDILTENLCSATFWNVIGLDVKNEPFDATWGTGDRTDFRLGAAKIANRMLNACPNWLAFVEGLNYKQHSVVIDGENITYSDWYGGGLQDVRDSPIKVNTAHKVVWAPHYYTSAVFVQPYFYDGGTVDPDTLELDDFVELSDKVLKTRVEATMTDMFGYLVGEEPNYALLLGEFGGLYAGDRHPKKTIQRTVDFTIATMLADGYAGGFAWSLNPESKYQYCSADEGSRVATYEEGLLQLDWLTANAEYLAAVSVMDSLPDLKRFPCFEHA